MPSDNIVIKGAKTHNLKNIDVTIPRNKLVVITGLSGSGKSSLAFDTIYAEGQRRYVESLSTYARQFLDIGEKPEVESIEGLSPAISIDQKTAGHNPRSTVATVTEIYDYLRLLYAKIGEPHCPNCGRPITRQTVGQIVEHVAEYPEGKKMLILSPVIRGKKGEHTHVLEQIKADGFVRLRVDGTVMTIAEEVTLDPKKKHDIEIVVDRLVAKDFKRHYEEMKSGEKIELPNPDRTRLVDSIELALRKGGGLVIIADPDTGSEDLFSENFACPDCNVNLPEIEPRNFSFNSPHGACPSCHGLGTMLSVDPALVIPNPKLTIAEGAIAPWAGSSAQLGWFSRILEAVAKKHRFSLDTPWEELTDKAREVLLNGTGDTTYSIEMDGGSFSGNYQTKFEGVLANVSRRYKESESDWTMKRMETYMARTPCGECGGKRLKKEMLGVTISDKSIIDATELSCGEFGAFLTSVKVSDEQRKISGPIVKELSERTKFLVNVGLSYLTLDRSAATLSGGEAQRIRLATQIGSKLTGVLYVLDEPSIGLHQRDNDRLIETLKELRDLDNTVIVVEHDEDTILASDHVIDIGPGAGRLGGRVIAQGTPAEVAKHQDSLTGQYLSKRKGIPVPAVRREGKKHVTVVGAREHNLQGITVEFPLGTFIAVTGVSGSGKSTLVNDILVPTLAHALNRAQTTPGKHDKVTGIEHLDKIIDVDQSPIGRTPRSNPATYTGVFTDIRDLFTAVPEAKLRGYKSGRFSFNVKGGRCEACEGDGVKKIEMHFLPDVYVNCEVCHGKRYNDETLQITWHGKNIAEVLNMTVEEASEFFAAVPSLQNKMATLVDVGLGYIKLGQSATTLSGGEAQRIKLATELARRGTGQTMYVLDEPTTGLHFEDVNKLVTVLNRLVEKGNTVLVIEHNLDVIKSVDHVIDLGPEGGSGGGTIIATGTPEEVAKNKRSYTGQWLKRML